MNYHYNFAINIKIPLEISHAKWDKQVYKSVLKKTSSSILYSLQRVAKNSPLKFFTVFSATV